jgi:hypothetical protein
MPPSGMLRRVALVRTDVSEELSAFIIRVTRIGKLGTNLTLNSNRRVLRKTLRISLQILSFTIYGECCFQFGLEN